MSQERRSPLPAPVHLAPWTPSLVLLALQVARGLGAPLPEMPLGAMLLVWLCTTLPLALLAWGLHVHARAAAVPADEQRLVQALQALQQAEAIAREAAAALARAQETLPNAPAGATAPVRRHLPLVAATLAVLLVAGGAVAYALAQERAGRGGDVHEHATFALFVDGERVRFTDPAFDLSARGFLRGHLHAPDDALLHIEGAPGLTLGEFMERALGARLQDGTLTLDAKVHAGRIVEDVRLFVAGADGAWREVADADAHVPRDGERLLLTAGSTQEEIGRQMMTVPKADVPS